MSSVLTTDLDVTYREGVTATKADRQATRGRHARPEGGAHISVTSRKCRTLGCEHDRYLDNPTCRTCWSSEAEYEIDRMHTHGVSDHHRHFTSLTTSENHQWRDRPHDGLLLASCWCGWRVRLIPAQDIRDGIAWECSKAVCRDEYDTPATVKNREKVAAFRARKREEAA